MEIFHLASRTQLFEFSFSHSSCSFLVSCTESSLSSWFPSADIHEPFSPPFSLHHCLTLAHDVTHHPSQPIAKFLFPPAFALNSRLTLGWFHISKWICKGISNVTWPKANSPPTPNLVHLPKSFSPGHTSSFSCSHGKPWRHLGLISSTHFAHQQHQLVPDLKYVQNWIVSHHQLLLRPKSASPLDLYYRNSLLSHFPVSALPPVPTLHPESVFLTAVRGMLSEPKWDGILKGSLKGPGRLCGISRYQSSLTVLRASSLNKPNLLPPPGLCTCRSFILRTFSHLLSQLLSLSSQVILSDRPFLTRYIKYHHTPTTLCLLYPVLFSFLELHSISLHCMCIYVCLDIYICACVCICVCVCILSLSFFPTKNVSSMIESILFHSLL